METINLRESLLKLDSDTCNQYDLTTIYDSCSLSDKDKGELVEMICNNEDAEVIYHKLSSYLDDDDISDMFISDVPVEGKYDIVIHKVEECLKEDFDNVRYNTVSNEYEFTKDDTGYTVGCCPVEQETEDYEVYIDGNFDNPICFDTEKDCVSYIVDYIKNKILNTDVSLMDDDDMIYVVYDIVEDEDRLTAKCMNESTNDFQDIKLGKINTDSVNKLLNNLLNNPNYKITKETKDKIYKNSAPWGLAVQMTPSVDVDGTNGLLATGDFGGEASFGESIETNFEKGDRVTDGDREGTVLNSDSEKVMVEWDYSETDDIEWVDKSTLELVNELNSRFLPNMEYCPACGGTRFNVKTGVCIDCGYNEGDWGTVQESLEENDEDGWGDRVEQILEPTIRKVEDLAYEVRNTVRGANTGCDTTDELADYVDEVIEDLEDANSSLRHEAQEIDESKSINEDALDDQGISKTRVDIIAKQAPNSKFYIDKNRYVLGKDLLDYFNANEILTYSLYETSDGIRVLNSYKIINRVVDESKSINEDLIELNFPTFNELRKQYKNYTTFKDKEKNSGLIRDLCDQLENKKVSYNIYNHKRDNGMTIFYDDCELVEALAPYKKEEFKKQLQDELYDKMIKLFYTPEWGYENIKEINDFINPVIDIEDYKGEYDNDIKVEFRAELNYPELEEICNVLDKVIQKYDKQAYFEPAETGIAQAYLKFPTNLKEDFEDDEIVTGEQEFDSAATSINSNKLPAVYSMVNFTPGEVVIDFGGGKFDNAVNYLKDKDVTLLVYDPYNRSAEHNKEVLRVIRENGGADAAINSNVLNVIKEPEARQQVLRNIKKLVKPGAPIYITVYEGSGKGNEGPTKSGYQLNRKTADYMDEISQVFSNVKRRGKLITAINESVTESYREDRKRLKDKIISTLEFLDTFKDIYKFPETILGDSWDDLKSGILMGIDTAYEEIAQTLVDYLEPSVEFDKRHPELLDEDPVAADALEEYENLKSELKESSYGEAVNEAVKGSKIKITGGSCDTKWIYDTMTTSTMSMYFVINNIPCEFKFSPNHGRYVVDGVDCNHVKFEGDSSYKDLTHSGGTARSYALNIPSDILKSQPDQKQKDYRFTGQYYSTTPAIRYCKELLKELLTQHPEYFHDDILDKLGLAQSLEESSYGGAFDIEDDQYFTKEEIVGVAEKVCEHLDETYPDKFDVSDVYMETPTIIHVEVISKEGNWASANAKIDMRKIKKPSDIMKYDVVIGTLVYNLRLELDDLYGDEYMRESLSHDKLSRELQTYLQRLFGDYVQVESVKYFESPFGEESYTAEINVSELVDNYIDKRVTPLTYKLKEDGYLYVNKYSDIIVDVNGYESGVTLDCYNTVPYDVDMEQLDKEADIIGDKIIDVIQSHEEDIYDILRQHYYEEIEDDEELAESLLDIEIDMWYDDDPKDVTSLDVRFSDLDSTYSGNLYINNKIVGDYTTKDSVTLEKAFPQFDWKAYWNEE